MANISTTNENAIYKYESSFTTMFKGDTDPLVLNSLRIKSVIVDYSYDTKIMPLIYTTLSLTQEMLDKLRANVDTGTVLFTVQKYIENSDMPDLKIDYINAECKYFISSDAGKSQEQPIDEDRSNDRGYNITIGFIALDTINRNKTDINGVIRSGSMSATLYYILKGQKLLMEPLKYNTKLSELFIPPSKSAFTAIEYLNNIATFYDTPYRFFIDFDMTYLMSSSYKGLKKKGEDIQIVKILLKKTYNEANMEGMYEDKENKMYVISVSATNASLMKNDSSELTYSKIRAVTSTGVTTNMTLNDANNSTSLIKPNTSSIRVSNNNVNILQNMKIAAANNAVVLGINKNKIDSSIFTINKVYSVVADEVYGTEYSGYYLLSSKREIYVREGQGLAMSVLLAFKKISNA